MRLVFIHGINNEDNSAAQIEKDWWEAILDGWSSFGLAPKPKPQVRAAFYGDILAKENDKASQQMGAAGVDASAAAFEFLEEYRKNAGLTLEEYTRLQLETDPTFNHVQQGRFRAALVRLAAAIAAGLPANGKIVAGLFLKQAVTYIDESGVREAIHKKVVEQVFPNDGTPTVVVAHSLGTVVAYNVLADASCGLTPGGTPVPFLCTLGSPLAIDMMDAVIPARNKLPNPPIASWVNGFRKDDFVALDKALKKETIGFDGITNYRTKMVDGPDPHSITQYLKAEQISKALHKAL
jgi:hypothetical protein